MTGQNASRLATGTRVVFRADAGPELGMGHAMRCLALCEEIVRQGGQALLLGHGLPESLRGRLAASGVEMRPLPQTAYELADARASLAVLHDLPGWSRPDWFVVDNYGLGRSWEQAVRQGSGGIKILAIDDLPGRAHDCDILLDQNLGAAPREPRVLVPESCIQLLGPRYALLRREFLAAREHTAPPEAQACRLLVTLGGGASNGPLRLVLEAVNRLDCGPLDIKVVIGPLDEVQELQGACPAHRLELLRGVEDMSEPMLRADVVIAAGGSTCWELASLGRPMLLFCLAENQRGNVKSMVEAGCALAAGDIIDAPGLANLLDTLRLDLPLRRAMSMRGQKLGDGHGTQRVAGAMKVPS